MGQKYCKWIGASFFPPAQRWKSCAGLCLLRAVAAFARGSDKPLLRLIRYSFQVILIGLNAEAVKSLVKLIYTEESVIWSRCLRLSCFFKTQSLGHHWWRDAGCFPAGLQGGNFGWTSGSQSGRTRSRVSYGMIYLVFQNKGIVVG